MDLKQHEHPFVENKLGYQQNKMDMAAGEKQSAISENAYYTPIVSQCSTPVEDRGLIADLAGWLANDKRFKGGKGKRHRRKENLVDKENSAVLVPESQNAILPKNAAHNISPRAVLSPQNGVNTHKPAGQRVPVVFLDEEESGSLVSYQQSDGVVENETHSNFESSSNRYMELMKRIQVLQEDKKALQVANARLVDRANEFESQALRYGRASKVQTKDIEKMKAQIDDLEDGFGSVILGDEPKLSDDDSIWRLGTLVLKPVYQLGRGSYGLVLCAINLAGPWSIGQELAIKVMDIKLKNSFDREVAFLLHLDGLEITPTLLATVQTDKVAILIMTKSAVSLHDRIWGPKAALSEEACQQVMKELISLIAEMHEREYIHFDIKPHNILFTSLGIMQLCDGGLSCCIQDICSIKSLTRGTEGYMAPEVLSGDTLTHPYAVDMYSVGVTLAHLRRVSFPVGAVAKDQMETLVESAFPSSTFKLANEFLRALLHEDPSTRLSAKEALAHPWITNGSEEPEDATWILNLPVYRRSVDHGIDIGPCTEVLIF